MGEPLRPIIGKNSITYDFGKGTETIKYKAAYFEDAILTRTAIELKKAKMDSQGNIDAETVNTLFLNLCDNVHDQKYITGLKSIFDACTADASDGGALFTTGEQQKVMSILRTWTTLAWK